MPSLAPAHVSAAGCLYVSKSPCPPCVLLCVLVYVCALSLCVWGCRQVHGRGDLGLLDALLHPEFDQGKRYIYLHVRTC